MNRTKTLTAAIFTLIALSAGFSSASAKNAPETLAVIDSVTAHKADLQDNVVYADFWASWCKPCQHSFPWMQGLLEKYHDKGLRIIAIDLDMEPSAGRKFLEEMKSPLDVIFDSTGALAKEYNVEAMPTSFIYGRDGKLRMRHQGFLPKDTASLDSTIQRFLKEESGK